MDLDPVAIDCRHSGFSQCKQRTRPDAVITCQHPSAINCEIGNAEREGAPAARRLWLEGPATKTCRSAQATLSNFIPFERFQIGLPLEKFRIIVPADRHYPVVPANTQKVRMPP
jgi:hypothetical protein